MHASALEQARLGFWSVFVCDVRCKFLGKTEVKVFRWRYKEDEKLKITASEKIWVHRWDGGLQGGFIEAVDKEHTSNFGSRFWQRESVDNTDGFLWLRKTSSRHDPGAEIQVKAALSKLVFVRLQVFWSSVRTRYPTVHRLCSSLGAVVFPRSRRTWMRGEGGIGAGLLFKLNPRFESAFLGSSGDSPSDTVWYDNLTPGAVFYDVGSHIGVFAVSASRFVGAGGAVYAFEPDAENVRLIGENAARNTLPVEVIRAAVWKSSGSIEFSAAPSDAPSRMGGHIAEQFGRSGSNSVPCVSLDDFVLTHRPPTFIKIDVEGAEAEVLEGAEKILSVYRPNMLIEIHNDRAHQRVAEILRRQSYEMCQLVPNEPQFRASPNGCGVESPLNQHRKARVTFSVPSEASRSKALRD